MDRTPSISPTHRERVDLCPGVQRPWPAEDGALVRLRLIGGVLSPAALAGLVEVAHEHGDGNLHLTKRANLQLRALPATDGRLAPRVVDAITSTGLLPSPSHELVRNVMVSPLSGVVGGRTDLRPLAAELDRGLCADPVYAGLSARFLFLLDDGRGDVHGRTCDLGLVAVDSTHGQLRIGDAWGEVVPLSESVDALLALARDFVSARGAGPTAPWHVSELASPLRAPEPRDPRTGSLTAAPAYGVVPDTDSRVEHVGVPAGVLTPELAAALLDRRPRRLLVTPWRSVLVEDRIV
ncbi:MAG: nitrite reductase [Nocardioides sp.]|nr:nitrite reductase [Nocardioides sp.]